jgi:molybdopterin-biosynthesis enzyme MoeA-like protein
MEIEGFKLPLVIFENVYVFPGIPEYLKLNFEAVKERFRGDPIHQRRLHVKEHESRIAALLEDTEKRYDVKIGSYPKVGRDMKVKVTIASRDKNQAESALQHIVDRLDPSVIIKID